MSWGAVIVGGAALVSGVMSSKASKDASKSSEKGTQQAIDSEWQMFQQNREDYAPWREAGKSALTDLQAMIKAGPGEFKPEEQPGYQFGFKNFIEQPYLSSQSAKGKRLSGETTKGLIGYAQDYATTAYDNFLNRYYQRLTPYQSMAGIGMTATNQTAQMGQQTAQNVGQYQYQNALNQGSYQTQLAASLGGIAQQSAQNYLNYKAMKQ